MVKRIKNIIDEVISSLETPWQISEDTAYSGKRVQELLKREIKAKVGYVCFSPEVDSNYYYHVWGFYSKEDCERYLSDRETYAGLLLFDAALPVSDSQAVYFDSETMTLYLFRSLADKSEWLTSKDDTLVGDRCVFSFTGTLYRVAVTNRSGLSSMYFTTASEQALVTLGLSSTQKAISDTEWAVFDEDYYVTADIDRGNTGTYENIETDALVLSGNDYVLDVKSYLISGSNRLRISVRGSISGNTTTVIYGCTLTTMYLRASNFSWWSPFVEGSTYNLGGMNIGGAIPKKLRISVTGLSGSSTSSYEMSYEEDLGTSTYINTDYFFKGLEFPTAGTGIYNVDIWLDANGLLSEHLRYNIMCVAADDVDTAQLVTLNNGSAKAMNYAENTLFQYALYNGGKVSGSPRIVLSTIINTNRSSITDITLQDVACESALTYATSIEVETEETNIKLEATVTFGNEQVLILPFDNSNSYPATSGRSLYFNASMRDNGQENRESVVDIATGSEIACEWTRMSFVDGIDGWTTDGVAGKERKCLYIPAGSRCVMSGYKPLSSFSGVKTLEFNYLVRNASDSDEPVMSIADDAGSSTFRGIVFYPDRVVVHSRDLNTSDLVQSYHTGSGEKLNVVISIIRSYKTNYGNLCVISCNGDKVCSFEFQNSDSWTVASPLVLGSETADLCLYSFSMYDKGFEWPDMLRNYINTRDTLAEKQSVNSSCYGILDDSFDVDYNLVRGKFNTMVVEMLNGSELPHYGLSKKYTAKCNMWLDILSEDADKPTLSGEYLNTDIGGQGTTSMNYWKWNLAWKKLAIRLTAKKNYASAMQSHKIGICRAFDDLHRSLGLDNEAGGFVAVYQYPVYGFQKIPIEGSEMYTYKFIGVFTIGPDKGDKSTFGYDKYADTAISLEGTDHNIKGVGMDYPWSRLTYVDGEESICVDKGGGSYDLAWEVSVCGNKSTEAEKQAYLEQEFAPAYKVAYDNSTMIMGTALTLSEINADVTAFGLTVDADGHSMQRYEVWTDGVYDLYYLDRETGLYTGNGVNLLADLGLSEDDVAGLSVAEKNELFRRMRRERFRAQMPAYWHLDDCLFTLAFLFLFGLKDNFKKNSYPYKLTRLADGGRWRWRSDDNDTAFDLDNQGLASADFFIEFDDWTDSSKTAYVFKGEDSVFWRLVSECFPVELRSMGRRLLDAMYELSPTGSTTTDKLMGFMQKYLWDNAQDYFTKSAYNIDGEYSYEEAWYNYNKGTYSVDVHPLSQALGRHYEAERAWVRLRLIYSMSKWGYGSFSSEGYNDTSLGRITFRTQLAQSLTLTPAIAMYPTVLSGQSMTHRSESRVMPGESVTLDGVGGTNTNVYIMGADYLESLGDLSALSVDASSNATLGVSSVMLGSLKIGDPDASRVTSNVQRLDIISCPSLSVIDARNLTSLTGTVDLSQCPRLREAYFGGTSAKNVTLAPGSKIERLELPASVTTIDFRNLKFLTGDGVTIEGCGNLQFLRMENCGGLSAFEILTSAFYSDGSQLRDIRITGFRQEHAPVEVIDMLACIAKGVDKNGEAHVYDGIDIDGNPVEGMLPVIQGYVSCDGAAYSDDVDAVRAKFPNLTLDVQLEAIRFEDAIMEEICVANWGGETGNGSYDWIDEMVVTLDGEAVDLYAARKENTDCVSNTSKLVTVSTRDCAVIAVAGGQTLRVTNSSDKRRIPVYVYQYQSEPTTSAATRLKTSTNINDAIEIVLEATTTHVAIPLRYTIATAGVAGTKGRITVEQAAAVSSLGTVFNSNSKISKFNEFRFFSGLTSYGTGFGSSTLAEITFPKEGKVNGSSMMFQGCHLKSIIIPDYWTTIGDKCFWNNTKLTYVKIPDGITSIGQYAFYNAINTDVLRLPSTVRSIQSTAFGANTIGVTIIMATTPPSYGGGRFGSIVYVPDESVDLYASASGWSAFSSYIHPLSEYEGGE